MAVIGLEASKVHRRDGGHGVYPRRLIANLLQQDGENRYVIFASRPLRELARYPNCEVIKVPEGSGLRASWLFYRGFHEMVSDHELDLLHLLSQYGVRRCPCPLIATCMDLRHLVVAGSPLVGRLLYGHAVPRLFHSCDHLIASSHTTKRVLVDRLGLRADRISTVPLGHDTGPNHAHAPRHQLPDKFVLWVGMATPRKNLETLFRAYARLRQLHEASQLELVIVGSYDDPRLERSHQELTKQLRISTRVYWTGHVPNAELSSIYQRASIFAFPSIYEGFGIPLVEAMSQGVPVVTSSDGGATTEVVGEAALLHSKFDFESLARHLHALETNEWLRDQKVAAGRERAKLFTWSRTAKLTLDVYRRLLRNPPSDN